MLWSICQSPSIFRLEEERNNKLKRKHELIEKLEAKKARMQQADKEIKRRFRVSKGNCERVGFLYDHVLLLFINVYNKF